MSLSDFSPSLFDTINLGDGKEMLVRPWRGRELLLFEQWNNDEAATSHHRRAAVWCLSHCNDQGELTIAGTDDNGRVVVTMENVEEVLATVKWGYLSDAWGQILKLNGLLTEQEFDELKKKSHDAPAS